MKQITTYSDNRRISTQDLLQQIYAAIADGETDFEIEASGQYNIGGPLWRTCRSNSKCATPASGSARWA